MKARYISILIIFSIIINIISANNLLLIMSTILLLLLVFIPNLYVKIVTNARQIKESDRSIVSRNLAGYGSEGITRSMNRFVIRLSLLVVYFMAIGSFLLQLNQKDGNIRHFFLYGSAESITRTLGGIGWITSVISLFLVTVYVLQLMKKESIFRK